jgi:TonB family protein
MDDRLFVSSFSNRRKLLRLIIPLWGSLTSEAWAEQDSKSQGNKSKDKASKQSPTVYTPGGDVKPPKVVHYVEPDFADTSKDAFVDGVVKLKATVTPDGIPIDIEIVKGLNDQENQNAVDAVKQWRFQPGTKGGEPVHVRVGIEIAFHLM